MTALKNREAFDGLDSWPQDGLLKYEIAGPVGNHMRKCARCGVAYDWRRARSVLRMTYCGILCEIAGLGFSLEA